MTGAFSERVKARLRKYRLFVLARAVRDCLERSSAEIDSKDRLVVSLEPEQAPRGYALVSYIIDPFLLQPGQPLPQTHTFYWESLQIAQTFLDLGYAVDAISWRNTEFVPQRDYAFFVDVRHNLERLAPLLNADCVKIYHSDTAHILFHNAAESRRLLDLQQRRGITLSPRRFEMPNLAIEHADYAVIKGNEFTLSTYRYANKPLYPIWGTPVHLYPWPEEKDFEACRKHFLFFSSGGMVHKGLDLVLEAFAEMPDHELTVCGPVEREKGFEQAFYKELYQTPNIHTCGWVDVDGPDFMAITKNCVGLIYPSCSEGQSGGVITCLHAGLIPIISYESGVDVGARAPAGAPEDFGIILRDCSVEEIKRSIRMISGRPAEELQQMAWRTWSHARANYTRELFAKSFREVISSLISGSGNLSSRG